MTPQDLLLAVVGNSDGQMVEGRTRFMKLIFLLEEEAEELNVDYDFCPHEHGPFSKEVLDDLEALESKGLVDINKTSTRSGNVKYNLKLTERGEKEFKRLSAEMEEEERSDIMDIIDDYGDMPIFVLLDYVYDEYPEASNKSAA